MACCCITESTREMCSVAPYLEGREILRSPLDAFAGDQPLTVIQHEDASAMGVTLRGRWGESANSTTMLLFNSCEHLANWCKTGRHRSRQIEDWLQSGGPPGTLVVGQLMPAALLTAVRLLLQNGLKSEEAKE